MKDYKDKIKKLLALAESNNEHEARAALLKAKELMAEYKIEEIDLADSKNRKVKRVYTDHYWTKRGEFWIGSLASVIAENYCCKSASAIPYKGAQKREIFFVGLEEVVMKVLTRTDAADIHFGVRNGIHERRFEFFTFRRHGESSLQAAADGKLVKHLFRQRIGCRAACARHQDDHQHNQGNNSFFHGWTLLFQ